MSQQQERDKLISGSTVKFGTNSKNNQRVQFYLSKESAEEVAALLVQKAAEGAGTGVKLDIHETISEYQGRTIKGGFMFVKAKQGQDQRSTTKKFTEKPNQAIIEGLKKKQVE